MQRNNIQRLIDRWVTMEPNTGCWIWSGRSFSGRGYGQISVEMKRWKAHRYFYSELVGPIPEGMLVCHRCDNPACVNPCHLFLGTAKDNESDKHAKGRGMSGERHWAKLHPERITRGERHGNSKLTDADVVLIRKLRREGWTYPELARRFGLHHATIQAAAKGQRWTHIPMEAQ